ncbi:MAG: hypothetical protein ABWZ67_00225 [Solirubrobacteraceae bacterium]
MTADGKTGLERWGRLLRTCAKHRVDVTAEGLDAAPFDIVLTERLERRLAR